MKSYAKFTGFSDWERSEVYFDKMSWAGAQSVKRCELKKVLQLDYEIRLLAQREEGLNHQARAWKKTIDAGDDVEQLLVKDFDSAIRSTRAERIKKEHMMFRLVYELDSWVTAHYDSLRRDRLWYMRKEMVYECAGRGGCCSRGCGCCARRALPENMKTRGHCTTECWCCRSFRDLSLTEEDQRSIVLDLDQLMSSERWIKEMANCYFRPLSLRYKLSRAIENFKSGLKRMTK